MAWSDEAGLGSGLPDRFQFTVQKAVVGNPYEKNPEATAVVLDGERRIDDDIEQDHLWLKVGAFEKGDKEGTFLVHETQSADIFDTRAERIKKINNRSSYGKFLGSLIDVYGMDALAAHQDPSRAKYEIWDLSFLVGLVLDIEMVEEPYSFKNDAGEQIEGKSRQPYVRAVLSADGATAAPAAATSNGSSSGPVDEATATQMAKDSASFVKYLEAVTEKGVDPSHEFASNDFFVKARG